MIVIGVAALLLAVPVAVSASHIFSDVPTSHTFHTSISRLAGSGITSGCGGGKYCPSDPVTRAQMAGFLNRGLGRGTHDTGATSGDDWATVLPGSYTAISAVDLTIGGGSGGTQHVLVEGHLQAFTDQVGLCPCELEIFLLSDSGENRASRRPPCRSMRRVRTRRSRPTPRRRPCPSEQRRSRSGATTEPQISRS